jgi:hypothetical protein
LSVSTAFAQNPHFNQNDDPIINVTCQTDGTSSSYLVEISGVVHGIGGETTGTILKTIEADFNCFNKGKDAGPVPGQSGPISDEITVTLETIRPGVASFSTSFTVGGSCKGNALASIVTALRFIRLELEIGGKLATPSLISFVPKQIDSCPQP